jgi:hypothetical protein
VLGCLRVIRALRARQRGKRTVQPSKVINFYLSLLDLLIKNPREPLSTLDKIVSRFGLFHQM